MSLFSFFKKKPKIDSRIHGPITFTNIEGNKALRAGGVTHSGGEIWPMWNTVIKKIRNSKFEIRNALILGVGGGDVLKLIDEFYPDVTITGVEIDPVMIEVAEKYFDMRIKSNVSIEIGDAIDWLPKHQEEQYDLVVCDLYVGPFNPSESRTESFMKNLANILTSNGIVLYNAHYQETNTLEFEVFMRTLKKIFHSIEVVFSYPLNRVLLLKK